MMKSQLREHLEEKRQHLKCYLEEHLWRKDCVYVCYQLESAENETLVAD